MKKWLKAAGVGLALIASSTAVNAAEQKIAVVDVAGVFQQLPQREKVARQLESEFKGR
ncbi:MAG: molecular chaperone, partial [Plesiomonas sp.]